MNPMTGHIVDLICDLLGERKINAAVLSIEGCGTSVLDSPEDIRSMGKDIILTDSTQPSQSAIDALGERVLDPKGSRIDPFDGVGKAFAMHYNKVAVLVTKGESSQEIRDCFGRNVVIVAKPAEGLDPRSLDMMFEFSDIMDVCDSPAASDICVKKGFGNGPVCAVSEIGTEMMQTS